MVRQIEIETRVEVPHGDDVADNSANAKLGDVPCLFGTLASQRYNWDDVIRIIMEVEGIAPAIDSIPGECVQSLVDEFNPRA